MFGKNCEQSKVLYTKFTGKENNPDYKMTPPHN